MLLNKIKLMNIKQIVLISSIASLCFFVLFKLSLYLANNTTFYNWIIVRDIVGINLVIGFLSIFSFFLYSYLYNDDYFNMFSLVYVSVYFEFVVMTFFSQKVNIFLLMEGSRGFLGLSDIFRTIIIFLTFFENNSITKYINKHNILAVIISIIITRFCIFTDIYLIKNWMLNPIINVIEISKIIMNIVTYLLLLGFCIQYLNKRSINYFITFIGTLVIFLSRILLIKGLYTNESMMYTLNRVLLGCGFAIIVISMFTEILLKSKENEKLTEKVIMQRIEMHNIKKEEELRNQFFANISHELRTPINILICSFELLRSKIDDKDKLYEYYKKYDKTIMDNSSRMLRLVNNIIDVSKFDAGAFKMHFVNCDIISVIENITMCTIQSPKLQNRNVVFDTNTEYLEMKCDVENIERVMLNLLSNAIKFTAPDGNILVECTEEEHTLKISVKDDGIGIPDEYREKIFQRFVQVDKSLHRNAEGSGIGLSLVKYIVEAHNGEIYINPEYKDGCEFIIILPKVKCDENDEENMDLTRTIDKELEQKVDIELSDIN
ncbi:HAMP domain-containing sensor histidine kinase [Clostridium sp. SM-530-WT-3G]|uniref:sensor histidine kinase n=1 Tax=Clostridium sp. SM-530-WT-3G TaxID=2725303 RepID=UPI00145E0CD5|nr:HAMP domain-containing sensor histidine kinase [Clostridium sp. SM-530-WT-3G]NME81691.1 HAMP domain-containing histidine kinase [Clostridium sp. SM-530-WT-3G]